MNHNIPYFGKLALKIVQHYFPQVTRVNDAEKSVLIDVTNADNNFANDKDHKTCGWAVACKRALKCDGVIVGMTRTYIVKGATATRYRNTNTLSREITSFDRKAGFDTGLYHLAPINPSGRFWCAKEQRAVWKKNRKGNQDLPALHQRRQDGTIKNHLTMPIGLVFY